jgi:hypothetical protein
MDGREGIWILGPRKPGIYIDIEKSVPTSQKTLHYKALSFIQSRKIVFLENHTKSTKRTKSFPEIEDVQIFYITARNRVFR